jgi:hypothetical protein
MFHDVADDDGDGIRGVWLAWESGEVWKMGKARWIRVRVKTREWSSLSQEREHF